MRKNWNIFLNVIRPKEPEKEAKSLFDSPKAKQVYWKRTNYMRLRWEQRYALLIQKVLNRQFKAIANMIDVTNYQNTGIVSNLVDEPVRDMLKDLYRNVGSSFARETYKTTKADYGLMDTKENEDDWLMFMENYLLTRGGSKITSITGSSRDAIIKEIQRTLGIAVDQGLGADETARLIKKNIIDLGTVINTYRAVRIARTEVVGASNIGRQVGAQTLQDEGYSVLKYWITTYDSRTRDTHRIMEEQNPKRMDEAFLVGGVWPAEVPHDPDLPAEEVINCRCTIAHGLAL